MASRKILSALALSAALAGAADFSAWSHAMTFSFNTTATGSATYVDIAHFPVLIRLDTAQKQVFQQAAIGGADIRFTKNDGATPVPFEIERWDAENRAAEIWVLVDTLIGDYSAQTIRMYWGKTGAASASDGSKVFDPANGFAAVWHF